MTSISIHALNRCMDHYGFVPSVEEAAAAVEAITQRRALQIGKPKANGTERWRVLMAGQMVNVAFAPQAAIIVTVLPSHVTGAFPLQGWPV